MANLPVTFFTGVGSSSSDGTDEFIAGDNRCMAQPTLLSLHNIFLLEHNRIARNLGKALGSRLKGMSPQELDELIFQV